MPARVAARFDEAVELAEQMFLGRAGRAGEPSGRAAQRRRPTASPRCFAIRPSRISRNSSQRFQRLNIRSSGELDELVERARETVAGVGPQQLRDSAALRQQISGELARIEASLDGLMIDRPRRNILRRGPRRAKRRRPSTIILRSEQPWNL